MGGTVEAGRWWWWQRAPTHSNGTGEDSPASESGSLPDCKLGAGVGAGGVDLYRRPRLREGLGRDYPTFKVDL